MAAKDMAGLFAVAVGLGGLIWNAAVQVNVNETQSDLLIKQDQRMDRLEARQDADHDILTRMQSREAKQ